MGLRAGNVGLIQRQKVGGRDGTVVFGTQSAQNCLRRTKIPGETGHAGVGREIYPLCLAGSQEVGCLNVDDFFKLASPLQLWQLCTTS